ncbi:MAG: YkvA family protein [Parvibaculum sp.]|uniref:YkvA family protein n=1 Tax=Parvibaculum sp. TaxID=2024848 RepID=UPI0034A0A475
MATSQGQTETGAALDPAHQLPAVIARNEKTVRDGFWRKMARFAGRVPFAEEAAAAWFCARDPKTPVRVKATLLAALAYFVTPVDFIPDVVAAFGFTDDAAVLMAAIGLVSSHILPRHRKAARAAFNLPPAEEAKD